MVWMVYYGMVVWRVYYGMDGMVYGRCIKVWRVSYGIVVRRLP